MKDDTLSEQWAPYTDLRVSLLPNGNIELHWVTLLPDGLPRILGRICLTVGGAKVVANELNAILAMIETMKDPNAYKPANS